jgi:hypothetical protein
VKWASVPKTSIYKDGDLMPVNDYVRLARQVTTVSRDTVSALQQEANCRSFWASVADSLSFQVFRNPGI